jgi:hypothetical protein
MAQRLQAAGFAAPQAAGAAEALAEALTGADLATKGDLASVRTDLLGAIELLRRDMTIKLGSMIFIAVGVLLAAMRYLPPHP